MEDDEVLIHVDQRQELLKLYPNSERWKEKVLKMPDNQVTAIYLRARNEGRLGK